MSKRYSKGSAFFQIIAIAVIVAVITIIVFPRFAGFYESSRDSKRRSDFSNIYNAVVKSTSKAVVGGFEYSGNLKLDTSKNNQDKNEIELELITLIPVEYTIVITEAVSIIEEQEEPVMSNTRDFDNNTWGVNIVFDKDKVKNIYISNGNYYSINANSPKKFSGS